jgi:hypothetical protein
MGAGSSSLTKPTIRKGIRPWMATVPHHDVRGYCGPRRDTWTPPAIWRRQLPHTLHRVGKAPRLISPRVSVLP